MKSLIIALGCLSLAAGHRNVKLSLKLVNGMMTQVKSQIKTSGKVTPGLEETFETMDGILDTLILNIEEDHDQTQVEIDMLHTAMTELEEPTYSKFIEAKDKDLLLVACRDEEKTALWEWEQCQDLYEECLVNESVAEQNVVENDIFSWEINADNACPDDDLCKQCLLYRDSEGGLETSLELCTDYTSLHDNYIEITDAFIAHWETFWGYYQAWQDQHEECVEIGGDCDEKLRTYVRTNTQCDELFASFKILACDYGAMLKTYCVEDNALKYFEEVVNSSYDTHSETGESHSPTDRTWGISEVDRQYEYEAVWKIKCMIASYDFDTGLMPEDDIATCEASKDGHTYETQIGSLVYKWWTLEQHFNCYEEPMYVTFSGKAWTMGHHSMLYQEYDYVFVVHPTLDNPESLTKAFSFCNDEDLQFTEDHLVNSGTMAEMVTSVPVVCPSKFTSQGYNYTLEQVLEREESDTDTNGQDPETEATTRNYKITVYLDIEYGSGDSDIIDEYALPMVTCEVDSKLYNFDDDTAGFTGTELEASNCADLTFQLNGATINCDGENDRLVEGDCNGDGILDRFCYHYPDGSTSEQLTALRLSNGCDDFPQNEGDDTYQWACLDFFGYDAIEKEWIQDRETQLLVGEGAEEQGE